MYVCVYICTYMRMFVYTHMHLVKKKKDVKICPKTMHTKGMNSQKAKLVIPCITYHVLLQEILKSKKTGINTISEE